jgi:hypothetical protein
MRPARGRLARAVLRTNLGFLSPAELCDLAQALHEVAGDALGELARRAQTGAH